MANLTQTAANVGLTDEAVDATLTSIPPIAGEALTQGQPYYKSSVDGKHYKADADASIDTAKAIGIVMTPAATDEKFIGVTAGPLDLGATLTKGTTYVVSATAGAIAPEADLTTNDYVTRLGTASETDTLVLDIQATNIQHP